jgi:hypothetical protein
MPSTQSHAKTINTNQNKRKPNDTKNARKQNRSAARQQSFDESDMSKRYALAKRLQEKSGLSKSHVGEESRGQKKGQSANWPK